MKQLMLGIVKQLDKLSGGAFRMAASYFWVFGQRAAVKNTVGRQYYSRAKRIRLVAFPNRLNMANNVYQSGYALEKVLLLCGIKPVQFSPWEDFDVCVNWQDLTKNSIDSEIYIYDSLLYTKRAHLLSSAVFINFRCNDISKRRIGEVNRYVFGYNLDIDPTEYIGRAVKKSDANATHDGAIIDCPILEGDVEQGVVYSVAVDNVDGGEVVDFRVPYIKGFIGFFYEKRRPLDNRFSNKNTTVHLRELHDEFSAMELLYIERFCVELGVDYGEFDVLRDRKNGRLYIVDCAKTPAGPPNGLGKHDVKIALERMSVGFLRNVIRSD
jgi:hypothetical protein